MTFPAASIPIRKMPRRVQQAVYRELKRAPGPVRTLNFRLHVARVVFFILLLYFVIGPLMLRGENGVKVIPLLLIMAIAALIGELIWRLVQVPAVEKALEGRAATELLAEMSARDAANHQPEKW